MSFDHDKYRIGWSNAWDIWWASGDVYAGGTATTLPGEFEPLVQPIGFRGAAPGASMDNRGKPRIRVKAIYKAIYQKT